MEASPVKPQNPTNGLVPEPAVGGNASIASGASGFSGFSINFANLLQGNSARIGAQFDGGLDPSVILDRAGAGAAVENLSPPADDHAYDQRDPDGNGRFDDPRRIDDDRRPDEAPAASRAEDNDDFGRDTADAGGDNTRDASDDTQTRENDAPPENEPASADGADDAAAEDDEGEFGLASSETDGQSGDGTGTGEPQTATATGPGAAEIILAGLIDAAENGTLPAGAAEQAQINATQNGQRQNAVDGLNRALAAVGSQTGSGETGSGETGTGTTPQFQPAQTAAKPAGQAQANTPQANTPQANTPQANTTETASATAQQAAGIAAKLAKGARAEIKVSVTNQSDTLVSQPASNLAASAVLAGTASQSGAPSNGGSRPAQNGQATAPATAQQAAVMVTPGQGQGTSAQAALAGSAPAAGAGTGGPAQALQHANQAAQPLQAGSDIAAGSGTASAGRETMQSQPATAAQTTSASHAAAAKPGVTEQISVQIAKAIADGVDRITVHLKPANLGRIEVQMEISQDGKVAAVVVADNKDTLDLLQRDAKELARALADAGLQADSDSLSFTLREEADEQAETADGSAPSATEEDANEGEETESLDEILDRLIAGDLGDNPKIVGNIDIKA